MPRTRPADPEVAVVQPARERAQVGHRERRAVGERFHVVLGGNRQDPALPHRRGRVAIADAEGGEQAESAATPDLADDCTGPCQPDPADKPVGALRGLAD